MPIIWGRSELEATVNHARSCRSSANHQFIVVINWCRPENLHWKWFDEVTNLVAFRWLHDFNWVSEWALQAAINVWARSTTYYSHFWVAFKSTCNKGAKYLIAVYLSFCHILFDLKCIARWLQWLDKFGKTCKRERKDHTRSTRSPPCPCRSTCIRSHYRLLWNQAGCQCTFQSPSIGDLRYW